MKALVAVLVLAALWGTASPAHAETPEQTYASARAALEKGADNEAVLRDWV